MVDFIGEAGYECNAPSVVVRFVVFFRGDREGRERERKVKEGGKYNMQKPPETIKKTP